MKRYFAKLDGNILGVDSYIRFEAESLEMAEEKAEYQAEENYSSYGEELYDEDGCPNFYYELEVYDSERHQNYFSHLDSDGFDIGII